MATLHVLRVFCAEDGSGGNELGVFLDGGEVPEGRRQAVAVELGFPETVFVDDPKRAELRIFTPRVELPLAGHPLVGAAWLLREERMAVPTLRPPAGEVSVEFERELAFVAADPAWAPEFELVELESPEAVDALDAAPSAAGYVSAWARGRGGGGLVRARVFCPAAGIAEDEATGAAAMRLVTLLRESIEIRQGRGSVIYARRLEDGRAQVGGRVVLDGARPHPA